MSEWSSRTPKSDALFAPLAALAVAVATLPLASVGFAESSFLAAVLALLLLPRDYGIPFGRLISSQAIHLRYMEDGLVDAEIIWLEKFRQYALQHDGNMSILESYADFQKYVKNARPDPTRSEWI